MTIVNLTITKTVTVAAGVTHMAYGIDLEDENDHVPSYAFDEYDLWFDEDLDYFIYNMLDDIFDDIESDITSVWSTNESE